MSHAPFVSLVFLAVLAFAAPARAADRYVCYVSVGEENAIAVYSMDPENGKLGEPKKIQLDGAPGSLALSPSGKYLYAGVRSKKSVATLKVDPATGGLTPFKSVSVIDNPVYLVPDQTGRFLFMASYGGNKIAVYPIGEDGAVSEPAVQVLDTGKNPHSILGDASNRYVYVPNTGADQILQFRFDEKTGKMTPNDPPKVATEPKSGPRHFRFHPTKPYVYFVNETSSSVTAFKLDDKGTLTALHTLSTLPEDFKGTNSCADIEVTPDGKYLYCSNRGHDSLAGYKIDPDTGRLTSLGQTPTEKTPREFALDPTGKFVYSAGQGSGKMASYRLDAATGKLTPLATYEVGKGPAWVLLTKLAP